MRVPLPAASTIAASGPPPRLPAAFLRPVSFFFRVRDAVGIRPPTFNHAPPHCPPRGSNDWATQLDSAGRMAGYVLIVESDAELQRQIGAALKDAGFDLAAETEASWAKKSVGTRMPDVVVVDTKLADGDGFTLADELRRAPETRGTPILFVASTHRGASHRAEARRRFAPADYLTTPLDLAALAPRVADLAARRAPAAAPHLADEQDGEQKAEEDGEDV